MITQENKDEQIQKLYNDLPIYVQEMMSSIESAEINLSIAEKYNLNEKKIPLLARVIGHAILKIFPLDELPKKLVDFLAIDYETAKNIALDIALRHFLPIRNHLPETINLITSLGGQLPDPLPPALEDKTTVTAPASDSASASAPTPTPPNDQEIIVKKDIMTAISQREEVANQNITLQAIRLPDSDTLHLPSIKNWLTDYKKYKSSLPNDTITLVRIKYLHESPNAKPLSETERLVLGKVLKSYDENTALPFSQKTGLLMINMLAGEKTNQLTADNQADNQANKPLTPPNPTPRINGNIVDLKGNSNH